MAQGGTLDADPAVIAAVRAILLGPNPIAWIPEVFADPQEPDSPAYVVRLGDEGVLEIERALESFKRLGLDGHSVCRDNFPLPTLQRKLDQASLDIHEGRGFCVLRDLNSQQYSDEDNMIIYLGISSYIGDIRGVQNKAGAVLTHITDSPSWSPVKPDLRHGIHTSDGLVWHTDNITDIIALHVRALAKEGGDTYLSSSVTVLREIATSAPDILSLLAAPVWPAGLSGEPDELRPLLQVRQGKIFFSLDPEPLGLVPAKNCRLRGQPQELDEAQRQALGVALELASRYRLRLDKKPGDVVFINNYAILHSRDPYVDASAKIHRRHLVRMWLRNSSLGWDVPAILQERWRKVFGLDAENKPKQILRRYSMFPVPDYRPLKITSGSAAYDSDGECADDELMAVANTT